MGKKLERQTLCWKALPKWSPSHTSPRSQLPGKTWIESSRRPSHSFFQVDPNFGLKVKTGRGTEPGITKENLFQCSMAWRVWAADTPSCGTADQFLRRGEDSLGHAIFPQQKWLCPHDLELQTVNKSQVVIFHMKWSIFPMTVVGRKMGAAGKLTLLPEISS